MHDWESYTDFLVSKYMHLDDSFRLNEWRTNQPKMHLVSFRECKRCGIIQYFIDHDELSGWYYLGNGHMQPSRHFISHKPEYLKNEA